MPWDESSSNSDDGGAVASTAGAPRESGWGDTGDRSGEVQVAPPTIGSGAPDLQRGSRGGWDESSDEPDGGELPEFTPRAAPKAGQSGPGRQAGSYGDPQVRAYLRNRREQEQASNTEQPPRGSIEAARLALSQQWAERRQQTELGGQKTDGSGTMSLPDFDSRQLCNLATAGSSVQRCVLGTFREVQRQGVGEPDSLLGFFLRCQSLTVSAKAMGDIVGCTRTHICRLLLSTACCVLQGAAWLWGFVLFLLSRRCQGEDPEWDPVLFLVKTMYDETPSRVRAVSTAVQTWMAPNAKKYPSEYLSEVDLREYEKLVSTAETGTHAKVLQTRYMVGMLLRHRETGAFGWFRGEVPSSLQLLDRTTAENIRAAVYDTITASCLHFLLFFPQDCMQTDSR